MPQPMIMQHTNPSEATTIAADDELATLHARADELVGRLTPTCTAEEAEVIEAEHRRVCEKIKKLQPLGALQMRTLQKLGDSHGLRTFVDGLIDARHDESTIRARILDELASRSAANGPVLTSIGYAMSTDTLDNPTFARQAKIDALYARMTGKEPEGAAREFFRRSLRELAGDSDLLESRGGTHTTSDFQNLLTGAGNRVLQDSYAATQSPLRQLARVRSAADFRPINVLRLSEAPSLEKVNEAGEVTYGSRGEEKEAFKLETFARLFSLSRQAITNDDLGAFADFNSAMGRAAAEREALQLLALLTANAGAGASLADGNPLFHASRGNKAASGSAITVDALAAGRLALRQTKGIDGKTPVGLTPKYLLVGPAKETEGEQVLTAILANAVANTNPFASKLELLVEPRLAGNAWMVFADTAQQQVLSVAYLQGARGPILETRQGWSTLGAEFRAVLDFGCGVTDTRGAYLNPGN